MRFLKWCALAGAVILGAVPAGAVDPGRSAAELGGLSEAAWSTIELNLPDGWVVANEGMVLDRGRPVAVTITDTVKPGVGRNPWEGLGYLSCRARCDLPESWRMSVIRAAGDFDYVTLRLDPWGRPRIVFLSDGGVHYGGCDVQCHDDRRWAWTRIDPAQVDYFDDPIERVSFRVDDHGRPHVAYSYQKPVPSRPNWFQQVLRYGTCLEQCLQASAWTLLDLEPEEAASSVRLALYRGKPRIAYTSAPGPVHVSGLVGTSQIHYVECWANRDCTERIHWTPPTQLTPNAPLIPATYVPGVSALDASDTGIDLVYSDQHNRRVHRRCQALCYREAGASWSPPRYLSTHIGTYQSLLSLTYDGNGLPHTLLFGERGVPKTPVEREVRHAWCVSPCSTALDWRAERVPVPVTMIATLRFDGDRPRLLSAPYDWETGTFGVSWSWCDERCGQAAVWPERPDTPPPATGPGSRPARDPEEPG